MTDEKSPIPHAERLESGVIGEEARMVEAMIQAYNDKKNPERNGELTDDLEDLLYYSKKRLACCPFRDGKPTCARCTIHCYRDKERAMIRDVMKTVGPMMLFKHPVMTFNHFMRSFKTPPAKPRNTKKS